MNKVIITGNLCADPEAYTTQSGVSRSSFKLAVQRPFKNAEGRHDADFLPVVVWRGAADFCNKYLKKGRKVLVEGMIQTRTYDAQDGSKRYVTEIIAENVETLDKADRGDAGNGNPTPTAKPKTMEEQGFTQVDDDGELPFE